MELLLRVLAAALLGILAIGVLKKTEPAFAALLMIALLAALALPLGSFIDELRDFFSELSELAELKGDYVLPVCKCTLIAVIARLGADLCRDSGVSAFASAIEITGTLAAFVVTLPLLRAVLTLIMDQL